MKAIRKWTLAVIIIVIIVGVVGATVYVTRRMAAPSFSLAPSTLIAVQGANITFNVYGLEPNGIATIYFGDGHEANTTSTLTHAYQNAGRYLVGAQEFVGAQSVASTFNALQTIQVTPQVSASVAPFISIPTITFNVTRNPSAPVVHVGDQVYLYAGYLEPPSGIKITTVPTTAFWQTGCMATNYCNYYYWLFGQGQWSPIGEYVGANSTSLKPLRNPITMTYGQPGLYPVTLTLVFMYVGNSSKTPQNYMASVEQTVAVSSASQPFAVFLYAGVVANPSVINVADNTGGAPFSFDPQVDYENVGAEVMGNIYSYLLTYNATSPGIQFIPLAAAQLPSVANGGISPDYKSYKFQIRTGMKFSNGPPLTAYDVWYSMVRDLLFVGGNTATPGWVLAQYLIPGAAAGTSIMTAPNDTTDFSAIMNALTYSNSSNTVTFRLVRPTVPELIFIAAADTCGAGILDASWLNKVGAGITFTPAGFYAYQNEANQGNLNLEVQNNPVASGPYMIQSYVPGQSITLVPNPGFPGVPGTPAANDTVVIQWVKDPQTAYNLFKSGQADTVEGLPPSYLALIPKLVGEGEAAMYEAPTLTEYFNMFNLDINATNLKTNFGPQYHIPSDYFDNLDVREAFAYAFNYTYYLDEIIGNKKYGIDFGNGYAGVIIQGLPDYVPPSQLQNIPTFNLREAKELLERSGEYGVSINIPVFTMSGRTNSFDAIQMWGAALNSIDPNIVMTPVYITVPEYFALNLNPGQMPIPLFVDGVWFPDYAYPSDFVDGMYKQGGWYPAPFGWSVQSLNSTGHADQATTFAEMNSLIQVADSTTNATLAAQDYKAAEQLAINLYMYVYTYVPNYFLVVKPYMHGYQNVPLIYAAGSYDYYVKTCGSTQACSGRGIGP